MSENINNNTEKSEASVKKESKPAKSRYGFRRGQYFATGIAVLVLAVIGLVCTVRGIVLGVSYIANDTARKTKLEKVIYPLVVCDPSDFGDTTELKNETIVSAACWDIIINSDTSGYEKDFDYILVSQSDIEQHVVRLFGSGTKFSHTSVALGDVRFYYDNAKEIYRIPYSPYYFACSPKISRISSKGSEYSIEVDYISPSPHWASDQPTEVSKAVVYELEKTENGYVVRSAHHVVEEMS